jgi:hypothetical protein
MKHAGSIALRSAASLGEETSSVLPVHRKGFFKTILMALHLSRRRQARHLVRRYRHLIAEDFRWQRRSDVGPWRMPKQP